MEERDLDLIERYIAGEATSAERTIVENRMQADPVFHQEVRAFELAQEALHLRQREELRGRFRLHDAELNKKKPEIIPGKRPYVWVGIIAIILLILFLLWNFIFRPGPPPSPAGANSVDTTSNLEQVEILDSASYHMNKNNQQESPDTDAEKERAEAGERKQNMGRELFAAEFEPFRHPMMDPTTRGDNELTTLGHFRKAYWEERYYELPGLFQKLDTADQQNDNYRFQLAIALLETGKVENAIPIFVSIIANSKSSYVAESYFYLGMAYLDKGDFTNAAKWMKAYLKLDKGKNKEKANRILAALK